MEIPEDVRKTAFAVAQAVGAGLAIGSTETIARALQAAFDAGVAAERERCAKVADFGVKWTPPVAGQKLVDESCSRIARRHPKPLIFTA